MSSLVLVVNGIEKTRRWMPRRADALRTLSEIEVAYRSSNQVSKVRSIRRTTTRLVVHPKAGGVVTLEVR